MSRMEATSTASSPFRTRSTTHPTCYGRKAAKIVRDRPNVRDLLHAGWFFICHVEKSRSGDGFIPQSWADVDNPSNSSTGI